MFRWQTSPDTQSQSLGSKGQPFAENSVTNRPIARQRLGKHIAAGANAHNNRTPITRQRIGKQASLTETVFPAWSVQSGYEKRFSCEELNCQKLREFS
jgi:hypothetical protein